MKKFPNNFPLYSIRNSNHTFQNSHSNMPKTEYRVYVIELSKKVFSENRKFREANPQFNGVLECLYVGMTRAKVELIVLLPEELKSIYSKKIKENMNLLFSDDE